MQIVPLQPIPSQTVQCSLGGQAVMLNVYQKSTGMFIDVYVNNVLIIGGVICQNANPIVRSAYLGFIGDLAFFDIAPSSSGPPTDPVYTGLGSQFILGYLAPPSGPGSGV
jgi:hypothetical protein